MRIPIATLLAVLVGPPAAASPGLLPERHQPVRVTAAPDADLVAAVRARAGAQPSLGPAGPDRTIVQPPQVTVARRSTHWGFGTVVRPAPRIPGAYPQGWLYVAHRRTGAPWQVALEGEAAFAALTARAPILPAPERRLLSAAPTAGGGAGTSVGAGVGTAAGAAPVAGARLAAAVASARRGKPVGDWRTGMRLPFTVGQKWRLTGGPHPMRGTARSSIDLAGGDGRVLAARRGVAYTMCPGGRGWLRIIHDRGFATDYYHLAGNLRVTGRPVAEGTFLGMIGNDVSCGGTSTGRHVHFSLLRNGRYVPINGHVFGRWVIRAGVRPYDGDALHGSYRARIDTYLHNYGALGFNQGIVDTDGDRLLNRRAGPGSGYRRVGAVADGATVTVACSRRGTAHTGRYRQTTNLWNRLRDGSWVSDAYLWTGTPNPVNGYCR